MTQIYGKKLSQLEIDLASHVEDVLKNAGAENVGKTLLVWHRDGENEAVQFADVEELLKIMDQSKMSIREYIKPLKLGEVRVLIFGDEGFFAMHVVIPEKLN